MDAQARLKIDAQEDLEALPPKAAREPNLTALEGKLTELAELLADISTAAREPNLGDAGYRAYADEKALAALGIIWKLQRAAAAQAALSPDGGGEA